jgi:hypothetical protein
MVYKHQPYPTTRYHKDNPPKLVKNAEEEKLLGEGWTDSPVKVVEKPEKAKVPTFVPKVGAHPKKKG